MVSDQRLIEAVSKYGRRCYKIRFRRYQTSIPVSTPHDLARLHATYWPEIWGDILRQIRPQSWQLALRERTPPPRGHLQGLRSPPVLT